MAGIHAHTKTLGVRHAVEDIPEMLEAIAQVCALAGGRLQVDRHAQARGAAVNFVEGPGDSCQTGFLTLTHVRAGMNDQVGDAKQAAALDLDGHRVDRFLPQRVVGTSQIDEIRGMGDRVDDSRLVQGESKGRDMLGRERRGIPLVVVLGEELNGLEVHGMRGPDRAVASSRDRHVSTEFAGKRLSALVFAARRSTIGRSTALNFVT